MPRLVCASQRLGAQLDALLIGFGGRLEAAGFLVRQRQVEPAFEVARHRAHQQGAELRGEGVFARGAGPRRQSLQRHRGFRPQLEQVLRILPHHVEVFFRHADQYKVGERFFGIRIAFQNLLIDLRRFVRVTERLQRHRLAELRLLVRRIQLQAAIEAEQRGFRIFLPEMAHAQAEVRIDVGVVQRGCPVERLCGVFPRARALQADGKIEPAHGVLRLHLGEYAVALGRLLEVAEFELNMPHGAIDLGRGFVRGNGAL